MQAKPPARAARGACLARGLDADGFVLLRQGTNSVYRLRSAPVVVRVAPQGVSAEHVGRQVRVARWLDSAGVSVVRALEVEQPVRVDGLWVTFWEAVSETLADTPTRYGSASELAAALRQIHDLKPPASFHLPDLHLLAGAPTQIDRLDFLEKEDRALLRCEAERLTALCAELSFVLPAGPIHGDASVGNLLRDARGRAVLADLDGFSVGPREWDLVLTAMYADRYGWHTSTAYKEFVEVYGHDVRAWGGYSVLSEARELLMILWLAGNAALGEKYHRELVVRLKTLRTGQGRRDWEPL